MNPAIFGSCARALVIPIQLSIRVRIESDFKISPARVEAKASIAGLEAVDTAPFLLL